MSSINEKLYGVAAVLRAQAGNVAVSMCNALATKLAAIPSMKGKVAAETFEEIISRNCNHPAMRPVRDALKAIEIIENLLRALESDSNTVLEFEFQIDEFYGVPSIKEEAFASTPPAGGLGILIKALNEQGVTWQWAPRNILSKAKLVIVRS